MCWVAAICLLAPGAVHANDDVYKAAPVRVQPNAQWQNALQSAADAKDANTFDERLIPLRRLAEKDWPTLFSQLLYFHDQHDGSEDLKNALVGQILHSLNPSRSAAIAAIVPHLDNEDASIRATAERMLAHYEDASPTRDAYFSAYRDIIEQNVRADAPTSEALIRHLFATDASLAMKTLVRAFQLRDLDEIRTILQNEHAVAEWNWKRRYGIALEADDEKNARRAIETCAAHNHWWVRLYAVKMMTAHAELATPAAIARIANDSHPLVAEAFAICQQQTAATTKSGEHRPQD